MKKQRIISVIHCAQVQIVFLQTNNSSSQTLKTMIRQQYSVSVRFWAIVQKVILSSGLYNMYYDIWPNMNFRAIGKKLSCVSFRYSKTFDNLGSGLGGPSPASIERINSLLNFWFLWYQPYSYHRINGKVYIFFFFLPFGTVWPLLAFAANVSGSWR